MSNKRLVVILAIMLVGLLMLIAREVLWYGRFAGLFVGIYLVPLLLIVSIMVGILLRMRSPRGSDVQQGKKEDC